jgi:hypothetical protein
VSEIDDLRRAIALYRKALDLARDCCGCSEGMDQECAADILSGAPVTWPDQTRERAKRLLA